MLKDYLSTVEVSRILGVSRITVFNWIKSKKIKAKKIGGVFLIEEKIVCELLKPSYLSDKDKILSGKFIEKLIAEYSEILKINI